MLLFSLIFVACHAFEITACVFLVAFPDSLLCYSQDISGCFIQAKSSDDLHCRFSGETGSDNKHHPNLAIYLKGCFNPYDLYVWYIHKTFVADWHWMTFRQVTPAHHCKYSTPDASCAMPSSSSRFGWPRRSRRRWAVGDRLLSRPNHHLHQRKRYVFWKTDGNNENT